ncbi:MULTISPECIES: lipase secretion chaperone [unclassified Duganella]|uniref:lipase secretion chaperone n=1 Tax=unclassified Duganella TaxID=2636909 RepID=UPI000E3444C7|nr:MULTISPECIES: lipase secretion chaperone [unclassified Duganella]RFP13907.1 lipase chaperone [Duganella sp. BJB475]RFP36476.1 lipase chaperone [Duganella sp. BJB476]
MSTNAKLLRFGALAVVVGAGLYLALPRSEAPRASAADPNYFAFVPSMIGTRPDGDVRQTAADKLTVNAELAYLFDYYLAGLGEKPLEAIRVEIGRELDRRLSAAPAAEAKRLLDAYLAYKRALVDVERGLPATPDLAQGARRRLEAMQRLRRSYFSDAEAEGLFSASDAYDLDAVARLEINADKSLTDAQRKERIAALDARLPQQLRDERDAPAKVLKLEEVVAKAREQGMGDNEIYRMRAAALSPEAAARLADVDREEADWHSRIASYLAQRQQLAGASDPAALQKLRDAIFSADEQKRLAAYE